MLRSDNKNTNNLPIKWTRYLNTHNTKEDQRLTSIWKGAQYLSHRWNKNYKMRYHHTVTKMAKTKIAVCCCFSHQVLFDSVTPWTVARQAPLSLGFPRQEFCSGLSFPSPGAPPDPGLNPWLLHWQVDSLPEPPGKPKTESNSTKWQRCKSTVSVRGENDTTTWEESSESFP